MSVEAFPNVRLPLDQREELPCCHCVRRSAISVTPFGVAVELLSYPFAADDTPFGVAVSLLWCPFAADEPSELCCDGNCSVCSPGNDGGASHSACRRQSARSAAWHVVAITTGASVRGGQVT